MPWRICVIKKANEIKATQSAFVPQASIMLSQTTCSSNDVCNLLFLAYSSSRVSLLAITCRLEVTDTRFIVPRAELRLRRNALSRQMRWEPVYSSRQPGSSLELLRCPLHQIAHELALSCQRKTPMRAIRFVESAGMLGIESICMG